MLLDSFYETASTSLLSNIASSLEGVAFVAHLQPTACPTIQHTMRNLISEFISIEGATPYVKRKATVSPANSDIALLAAWYASAGKNFSKSGISLL